MSAVVIKRWPLAGPPRPCSPATGSRRPRCSGRSRSCAAAGPGGCPQLGRRQRLHRAARFPGHARHRRAAGRDPRRRGRDRGGVRGRDRGVLHRPDRGAAAHGPGAGRARRRPGRRITQRRHHRRGRDQDHRHGQQDRVPPGGGYQPSAGWPRGRAWLAPGLATMLCVLTTDRRPGPGRAGPGLREATRSRSTGWTPTAACPPTTPCSCWPAGPRSPPPAWRSSPAVLTEVCADLARQLQADAEAASKLIAVEVVGAASEDDAVTAGRPWPARNTCSSAPSAGRTRTGAGASPPWAPRKRRFEPERLSVAINGVWVCRQTACAGDDRPRWTCTPGT